MRRRRIPLALVMLAALGSVGCGGDTPREAMANSGDPYLDETAYGFDDFDMDGDSELDANEFHEWAEGPLLTPYMVAETEAAEAIDKPDALSATVLIDGLFQAWDDNVDGALDRGEWARATTVLESFSMSPDAWLEFDIDGNDVIDLAEVYVPLDEEVVVAAIDADEDGAISDVEMNEWFFDLFDVDESGAIDRDEWRLAELYFDVPTL